MIKKIAKAAAIRKGIVLIDDKPLTYIPEENNPFYDSRINKKKWTEQENSSDLLDFFKTIALCTHSIH
jgi:hypothetical protein